MAASQDHNFQSEQESTGFSDEMRRSTEEGTRRTAEQAARLGRQSIEAGEDVSRSGAQIVQNNADFIRRAWKSYFDLAAQVTGRSGDEFTRSFGAPFNFGGEEARKAAEQSSRNVDAIVDSSSVLAKGYEDIAREWFNFARGRVEHNLAHFGDLTRCRSPHELAATQSDMMRDNLEVLFKTSRKMADISARIAEEAMNRMTEATERARAA
jgi:hypothetical protein